jgi:hypothetical protein
VKAAEDRGHAGQDHSGPCVPFGTAFAVGIAPDTGHPGNEFLTNSAHEPEHRFRIDHPTIQIETNRSPTARLRRTRWFVCMAKKARRLLWSLFVTVMISEGHAQTATIAGTGAATCATFLEEVARNPISEREYFSWAQGYMSGILMRAPPGKDERLDLRPPNFQVGMQLEFLRSLCTARPHENYSDAVEILYRRLRDFVPK